MVGSGYRRAKGELKRFQNKLGMGKGMGRGRDHRRFYLSDLILTSPFRGESVSLMMHDPGSEYQALEGCSMELFWTSLCRRQKDFPHLFP